MTIVASTPEPGLATEEVRLQLRAKAKQSLFYFSKAAMEMKDLTPTLHGRVADFISAPYKRRKLLQLARAHLKSSIGNLSKRLWIASNFLSGDEMWFDENVMYWLVVCSTAKNAWRFGRFDTENIEKPIYQWLFPEIRKGAEWSNEAKILVSETTGRKVVFEYIGVGGKASSRHFRGITIDDGHAAEEGDESPPAVEEVTRWYGKTDALLIEPDKDMLDVLGTNCSLNPPDIYLQIREKEAEQFDIFEPSSCYDTDGNPVWPERFPHHVLAGIRRKMGDEQFAKNYLNNPIDDSVTEMKSAQFHRFTIADTHEGRVYFCTNKKKYYDGQMSKIAIVDLAGWRGKGDKNAIVVLGRTADEMTFVLRSWKKRGPPDELIEKILQLHDEEHFPFISVEEVAYQECLSYFLEKRIEKDNLDLTHKPCAPHGEGTVSRVRSMQPFVRTGQVAIADNDVLFLEEATRFPKGEDHLLSAWAYGPQVWETPTALDMAEIEREQRRKFAKAMGAVA